MSKSYEEINQRIAKGEAVILSAMELKAMAAEASPAEIAKKVDVVTTATFGAMCSSGCFINFGHPEPGIRMERLSLNGVPLYGGIAAVDAYLGATEASPDDPDYGGAHVIEALIRGEEVELVAHGKGTDCYPRRDIRAMVGKDDLNEFVMCNPRNAYQNYPAAVNTRDETIHTYMGTLLPRMGNLCYSTSGELSPLLNDPELRTIGLGTRVFLGGAVGMVAWNGTQFNTARETNERGIPVGNARTLMLVGNCKEMSERYVRAASFERYGVTLFVGIGVPVPVLDEDMAYRLSVRDGDIETIVCDYGSPGHPVIARKSYAELRSGKATIRGKEVRTAPLSSLARAREIALELKAMVLSGSFPLTPPVAPLPRDAKVKPFSGREVSAPPAPAGGEAL